MARNLLFTLLFTLFFLAPVSVFGFSGDSSLRFLLIKGEVCEAPAPDSFRITSIGGNFISLAWTPAWQGATHVLTVSEKNASGGWNTLFVFPNVEGSTYTVDSLKGGKEYRFIIATKCSSGDPSELSASVDGIALIVELTLIGRTPKNPTPVSCHGIEVNKHNWVGFRVAGEGESNLFELQVNGVNSIPFGYIRRVINENKIVAADIFGFFPSNSNPTIDDVLLPFRILRLGGISPIRIGLVTIEVIQSDPLIIDVCIDNSNPNEPWKSEYTFTALTAEQTIVKPSGGNNESLGYGVEPTIGTFKVQNPIIDNLHLFIPEEIEMSGNASIRLFNSDGQIVFENELEYLSSHISFSVEWLQEGVYILQIENNSKVETLKVIKTR